MEYECQHRHPDLELKFSPLHRKTLAELQVWENYGVIITRIRRQGLDDQPGQVP